MPPQHPPHVRLAFTSWLEMLALRMGMVTGRSGGKRGLPCFVWNGRSYRRFGIRAANSMSKSRSPSSHKTLLPFCNSVTLPLFEHCRQTYIYRSISTIWIANKNNLLNFCQKFFAVSSVDIMLISYKIPKLSHHHGNFWNFKIADSAQHFASCYEYHPTKNQLIKNAPSFLWF